MKRSDFLKSVQAVYDDDSIDYLIALRDALSIIILRRHNPNSKPLEQYEGWVKYA